MPSHDELKARAAAAYNAAADCYDAPENTFWERFGARTVERLALRPGMQVLDVCSGTGASAIPAALEVGRTGRVIAVDVAENLLARLRVKARQLLLDQLEARPGDLMAPPVGDDQFDAVICVFGIFFAADMAEALRRLWARVRPGGRLAITTWGPRVFEPANGAFWDAVRAERPDLHKGFNPWDTITTPEGLGALFRTASVPVLQIEVELEGQPLGGSSGAWALIMGSGYRGTVEQLSGEERARVQERYLAAIAGLRASTIETNVIYACAAKPGP